MKIIFYFLTASLLASCNKNNDFLEVYKEFYSAFPSDLIKTKDGGFIIAGWGRSSKYYNSSNGIAIKLNSKGKSVWLKEYGGDNSYGKFKFVVNLDDGEYFLGGTKDNNIWLTKINSKGDILLEKTYDNSFSENGEGACYDAKNKSLFIVGNSNKYGTGDATILKIDNNGNILNKKILKDDGYENIFSCIIDHTDSSLILTGSKYVTSENGLDGLVVKINKSGNLIWNKTFGGKGGEVIWDSEIDNEGNYILSGTSTLSKLGTSATILKIDKTGRSIYAKHFEDLKYTSAKNIIKTSNNTFIVIGRGGGGASGHKDNKLLILNLKKNSSVGSYKVISKSFGIEGKIAIETNEGDVLVSGTTSHGNIYTLKIIN